MTINSFTILQHLFEKARGNWQDTGTIDLAGLFIYLKEVFFFGRQFFQVFPPDLVVGGITVAINFKFGLGCYNSPDL